MSDREVRYSPNFATEEGFRLLEAVSTCSSAAVVGHRNPDGDCIGSAAGLAVFLKEAGVDARCLVPGGVPERYEFLVHGLNEETPAGRVECAVALDVSTADRLDEFREVYSTAGKRCVIDHHPDNDLEGDVRWVEPSASSVAEMLWALLRGKSLTSGVLNGLYVGMMTDTGRFSFSNTSAGTLEAAAEMVRLGVNPGTLFERVYRSRPLSLLQFEAEMLRRIEVLLDGMMTLCVMDYAGYKPYENLPTEDLSGRILEVEGAKLAVLLLEREPGRIKISLRSRDGFDAAVVARELGGGGHSRAAGAEFAASVQDARAKLLELVKEVVTSRGGKT